MSRPLVAKFLYASLLLVMSAASLGCASMFSVRRLDVDRFDDGFNSVLLMRLHLVDQAHVLRDTSYPNLTFIVHKPGEPTTFDIPNPDSVIRSTSADARIVDASYVMESRAYPMEIEGGSFVSVSGATESVKLPFTPAITIAARPGQLTHLGILTITITKVDPKGHVSFNFALVRDAAAEQEDLKAFRTRFPTLAEKAPASGTARSQ
jgi:hypothetical protein